MSDSRWRAAATIVLSDILRPSRRASDAFDFKEAVTVLVPATARWIFLGLSTIGGWVAPGVFVNGDITGAGRVLFAAAGLSIAFAILAFDAAVRRQQRINALTTAKRVPHNRDALIAAITDVERTALDYLRTVSSQRYVHHFREGEIRETVRSEWDTEREQKETLFKTAGHELARQVHIAGDDFSTVLASHKIFIGLSVIGKEPDYWGDEGFDEQLAKDEKDVRNVANRFRRIVDSGGSYLPH